MSCLGGKETGRKKKISLRQRPVQPLIADKSRLILYGESLVWGTEKAVVGEKSFGYSSIGVADLPRVNGSLRFGGAYCDCLRKVLNEEGGLIRDGQKYR